MLANEKFDNRLLTGLWHIYVTENLSILFNFCDIGAPKPSEQSIAKHNRPTKNGRSRDFRFDNKVENQVVVKTFTRVRILAKIC